MTTPLTKLRACLTCTAKVTERCRTPAGNTLTRPHDQRLTPVLCRCGELLPRYKRYCDPCRVIARREAKRDSAQRLAA